MDTLRIWRILHCEKLCAHIKRLHEILCYVKWCVDVIDNDDGDELFKKEQFKLCFVNLVAITRRFIAINCYYLSTFAIFSVIIITHLNTPKSQLLCAVEVSEFYCEYFGERI